MANILLDGENWSPTGPWDGDSFTIFSAPSATVLTYEGGSTGNRKIIFDYTTTVSYPLYPTITIFVDGEEVDSFTVAESGSYDSGLLPSGVVTMEIVGFDEFYTFELVMVPTYTAQSVLVPIAVSSQLDVTGEERIHATNYVRITRPPFFGVSGDLADGNVSSTVDYSYTVVGANPPFTATIVSGSLPTGLSMDSTGHVTGTLEAEGVFSWTVQVEDSLGNTVLLMDSAEAIINETAGTLLEDIEHWWGLDGDLEDDEPTIPADLVAFSTTPDYAAGVNGQETRPLSHMGVTVNNGAISTNFSFWFWIHVIGTAASLRTQIAVAQAAVTGTPRMGYSIYNNGTQGKFYIDDSDDADEGVVTHVTTPGTTYFIVINGDWSAKTADLYVDGSLVGTTSPVVSDWWHDMNAFLVRSNSGTETDDAVDYVSQLGFMRRKATTDEITYLYNSGDGKTYADVVSEGGG